MTDQGLSVVSAVLINALIFTGMAFASMGDGTVKPPPEEFFAVDVTPVQLPKLGIEPPKKALPRIVEPAPPPPPETDKISLSREKKKQQEELEKKKKKEEEKKLRETAEKKRRDEIKRKEEIARQKEEDEAKARKKRMQRALRKIERDKRADEDNPAGFADGDRMGNSTDPNARRNKATYINRVIFAIQQQFEIPTVIPSDQRDKLKAKVAFKFDKNGKLTAAPRIVTSSGNRLFDQAAERALKKFGAGGPARIPVPPFSLPKLRKSVLKTGLTLWMSGKK